MTYEGRATRVTNRVLMALVVITIAVVAFWAMAGGLDEIPVTQAEVAGVTE